MFPAGMHTATKIGIGAVTAGTAVGGLVMLNRVRDTSGDPYSGRPTRSGFVIPRAEVLQNTAAWGASLGAMGLGTMILDRHSAASTIGTLLLMAGTGFAAGQIAGMVP